MKVLKRVHLTFFLSVAMSISAYAAEPIEDTRHKFEKSAHEWQLNGGASPVLSMFEGLSQSASGQYDLSSCLFCSGEGDNCESDGVFEINLISQPQEPILAVVCHVGAHSQRLQILAPWRHKSEPTYTATGAYYLTFDKTPEGVRIQYDRQNDDDTYKEVVESWP
jgi:hypothetical protein